MKANLFWIGVAILLMGVLLPTVFGVAIPAPSLSISGMTSNTATVKVVDEEGNPIRGAHVYLQEQYLYRDQYTPIYEWATWMPYKTTNQYGEVYWSSGAYSSDGGKRVYRVVVFKDGYDKAYSEEFDLTTDRSITVVMKTLSPNMPVPSEDNIGEDGEIKPIPHGAEHSLFNWMTVIGGITAVIGAFIGKKKEVAV